MSQRACRERSVCPAAKKSASSVAAEMGGDSIHQVYAEHDAVLLLVARGDLLQPHVQPLALHAGHSLLVVCVECNLARNRTLVWLSGPTPEGEGAGPLDEPELGLVGVKGDLWEKWTADVSKDGHAARHSSFFLESRAGRRLIGRAPNTLWGAS